MGATTDGENAAHAWDASKLAELSALADAYRLVGFIVLSGGRTVLSVGDVTRPCVVHSMRKSFISALYGLAIDRGQIGLQTTIGDIGIDDDPKLTDAERRATIADLLTSRSGVYLPAQATDPYSGRLGSAQDLNGIALRPTRGSHPPGTQFVYNNWDFNVLGSIYERLTQKSVFVGLDQYLARPLGFQDFSVFDNTFSEYKTDILGGNLRYPAYRMALSARDVARFAQLFLQDGTWCGTQIVPAAWVRESTSPKVSVDSGENFMNAYGYLWWVANAASSADAVVPSGSYSAVGAGGNFATVMPELDTVVVALVDTEAPEFRPLDNKEYRSILEKVIAAHPSRRA